jgi:hypothetical protein
MKSFKDNADRSWQLSINVESIKIVRALCDLDLLKAVEGEVIPRLKNDAILLVDVLYALCKTSADLQNITAAEFGRAMAGDAIEQATAAFLEELINFFPTARRQVIRLAIDKMDEVEREAISQATAEVNSMDAKVLMQQAHGALSGSSPEDSALTPGH